MGQVAELNRGGRIATLRRDWSRGVREERERDMPVSKGRLLQAEGVTCKGPKVESPLVYSRNSKEDIGAGVEYE